VAWEGRGVVGLQAEIEDVEAISHPRLDLVGRPGG
jgi:hypothetical protein